MQPENSGIQGTQRHLKVVHGKTLEEAIELVNGNNAKIQYNKVRWRTNTEWEHDETNKENDQIEVGCSVFMIRQTLFSKMIDKIFYYLLRNFHFCG